jgi:hypothetical protein
MPFDRAHRGVSGPLSNSVGTPSWANRRWKYFGKHAQKPVFGKFPGQGLEVSGRGGSHSIELVEVYLDHYQTPLEHLPGRIAGGNTLGGSRVLHGQISLGGFSDRRVGGSGPRWCRWIGLAEFYLEHCLTQLEHFPGRIAGGNTLENMLKNRYLGNFRVKGWKHQVGVGLIR